MDVPGQVWDVLETGPLERSVLRAVARHLKARHRLARQEHRIACEIAETALTDWQQVVTEIEAADVPLAGRAHIFHARPASRHQPAYRAIARRLLVELASCARFKTRAVLAASAAVAGDIAAAAAQLDEISHQWRADMPVRLPGLRAIELAAAQYYAAMGDGIRARDLADRAATVSGVWSAYPEDAPASWPRHLDQRDLLNFAFAAARLPDAIETSSMRS